MIFVCTDYNEIFFSKLKSAGLNYNLTSFFSDSKCAGVSNKHCLLTFFIFFVPGEETRVIDSLTIRCDFCQEPESYNSDQYILSSHSVECPYKKTFCTKKENNPGNKLVECDDPYDKNDPNSKYKMDRLCRCYYEGNYIPLYYEFDRQDWTCAPPEAIICWKSDCPNTDDGRKQNRGLGKAKKINTCV